MEQYTLITGASSGIGEALAKVFAKNGHHLILVGRNEKKLKCIQVDLQKQYKIKVYYFIVDLSKRKSSKMLYEQVKAQGLNVNYLINNAGIGYIGDFYEIPEDKDLEVLTLNIESVTLLTKYFIQDMKNRGEGYIVNVASTGAYHPGPYIATYYATKAYVLSLTEALTMELRPYGITVSALCPGATRTAFASRAGRQNARFAMCPDQVAEKTYRGIKKKKAVIVPGIANQCLIKLPKKFVMPWIMKYQKKLES